MARVRLSLRAIERLERLISSHGLPADTRPRVRNSLRALQQFPLIGRELEGRWCGFRFILGPWPWMVLVYKYDSAADVATIVAFHDARSSTAATAERS